MPHRVLLAFTVVLALGSALSPIRAQAGPDFFAALDAYRAGDHETAFKTWRALAYHGDVDAQYNLGTLYENGEGVEADPVEAGRWYGEAAYRKLAAAEVALARLQRLGLIEAADPEQALNLLKRAARRGAARAQFELGVAYDRGLGVTQNFAQAALWYQRAAEQGLTEAQYNLATLFDEGLGAPKDPETAYQWYLKAAENGSAEAQNNLGYMHQNGVGVPQDYAVAAQWYQRAADQGLAVAQNNLGIMFQFGYGVERNHRTAARWYRAAAKQGEPFGQNNVGLAYANGVGVERDRVEAMKWFILAAEDEGEAGLLAQENREEFAALLSPAELAAARRAAGEIRARSGAWRRAPDVETEPVPLSVTEFGNDTVTVQRLLTNLGYYDGKVDGLAGPITMEAVQRFVRKTSSELPVRISRNLIQALEKAHDAASKPSQGTPAASSD